MMGWVSIRGWAAAAAAAAVSVTALPPGARAQETRFAVVDMDPKPGHEKLVAEIEREIERLKAGSRRIDDEVMRRLLATGEGPAQAAQRLLREAQAAKEANDCKTAVAKAKQSETMLLGALTIDEERDPLKALYMLQVICEERLKRPAELALAAARLRSLVELPPADMPPELWQKHVEKATFGNANVELQVDSDPANGQVSVNLHGVGATPRTLKVAPGLVFVEVQKEGYKKAFRAVEVKDRPVRTALRLIPRAQDRTEQTENQLRFLVKGDEGDQTGTLSRLSQLARVETLVLMKVTGSDRVKISFFDAERGALAEAPVESRFDAATGKVAALANRLAPRAGGAAPPAPRPTPPPGKATPAPTPPAPSPMAGPPQPGKDKPPAETPAAPPVDVSPPPAPGEAGLPEAQAAKQQASSTPRKKRPGAPWWSWVIAGAVGAAFITFMYSDRVTTSEKIDIKASWPGMPK
jgi:hypothetical protein